MGRPRKTNALQPVVPIVEEPNDFYRLPDSPGSKLIFDALGAGENLSELPDRKREVSHGLTYEVLENGNKRQVSLSNSKSSITVELADIEKLTGTNKTAKKFFVLALVKANEQALHSGQLTKDYITFPLQELIDCGFYKTPQSARKGFKDGTDTLTSLKIKGHTQITKSRGSTIDSLEVLFTGANIKNRQCTLYLNPRIDWSFIAQYYTILPSYCFRLSNRAFDLLHYIFFLARQKTREIKKDGCFNISFRAIQHTLLLPSEVGCTEPGKLIKDPIEKAIVEIENQHSSVYGTMEFQLLPVYDENANAKSFLDNGYLKVSLSGSFSDYFTGLSSKQEAKIEAAAKRQEKIVDAAKAKALTKSMEEAEKSPSEETPAQQ